MPATRRQLLTFFSRRPLDEIQAAPVELAELIGAEQLDDPTYERPIVLDEEWLGRIGPALLEVAQIAAEAVSSRDPRIVALAARISGAADEIIAEVVEVSDVLERELAA